MTPNDSGNCVCNLEAVADDVYFPVKPSTRSVRVMKRFHLFPTFFPQTGYSWGRTVDVEWFDQHYDTYGWYGVASFPREKLEQWRL